MTNSLSVVIITKNEGYHIQATLESVKWANEIIVLDSGSVDNTLDIARKYTSHVYVNKDWQGYGIQKQRALEKATGEWVLNIDADEVVSESLRLKLLEIMQKPVLHEQHIDGCRIPILMVFNNLILKHSSSPCRHIRFFRRKGAFYQEKIVHENIQLPSKSHIIQLKTPLLHYSFQDVHHALYKMNCYSSYTAKIRNTTGSMTKAIFSSIWMFIRCYFIQGGFLDKKPGFLLAVLNAQGSFYREIKQIYRDTHDLPRTY